MTILSKEEQIRIEEWIEAHRDEYIRDLQSIINIKSVATDAVGPYPFGEGTRDALDATLDLAQKYGFVTENDEYYAGSAILEGKSDREFAFVAHLDVVPEGEGWSFPPYESTVIDQQITGRGSSDDKGPLMAVLYAMRAIKELGFAPKYTVRLLMGCQEECGMNDLPYFLEKHKEKLPELFLVCDCPFPIHYGEKGIMTVELKKRCAFQNIKEIHAGLVNNSIPAKAFAYIENIPMQTMLEAYSAGDVAFERSGDGIEIKAEGVAGHAAFPQGSVNAIGVLCKLFAEIDALTEEEYECFSILQEIFEKTDGACLGIQKSAEKWGETTCAGTILSLEDNLLTATLNIRYVYGQTAEEIVENIQRNLSDFGFELEVISDSAPYYQPLDSLGGLPLKLASLAERIIDEGHLEAEILAGGTHARILPNAIGFGPDMDTDPPCIGHAHAHDETVRIDIMERAIKVYANTIMEMEALL